MHGAQPAACSARAVEDAWADEGLSFSWTLDNFVATRMTKTGRSLGLSLTS